MAEAAQNTTGKCGIIFLIHSDKKLYMYEINAEDESEKKAIINRQRFFHFLPLPIYETFRHQIHTNMSVNRTFIVCLFKKSSPQGLFTLA